MITQQVLNAAVILTALMVLAIVLRLVTPFLWQALLRHRFARAHGVSLSSSMHLRLQTPPTDPGAFSLGFPRWEHACEDGTRDRRFAENDLLTSASTLALDGFRVSCEDPRQMLLLVEDLRNNGSEIGLCPLEAEKLRGWQVRQQVAQSCKSAEQIYETFRETSWYGFEEFVAELLRSLGWRTQVTPPSGDGGYDVSALDPRGRRYLAECKCYEPGSSVGRPQLQKLVGANTPQVAEGLLFVTTATFTRQATDYARENGMRLVDGAELVRLVSASDFDKADITPKEPWHLTIDELLAHYPQDALPLRCSE